MSEISIIDSKERLVAGWASVEVIDTQGEFAPVEELQKAFIALMDRGAHIIYGHQNHPIGKILQWEIKEHPITKSKGIYMIVKVNSGYEADDIVWNLIKEKRLKGFSIGGKGKAKKEYMEFDGVKKMVSVLKNIQLNEVSIVPEPANQFAKIDQISEIAKCDKCGSINENVKIWKTCDLMQCVSKEDVVVPKDEDKNEDAVVPKEEESEKSEGAMTSGDAGNHPVFSPIKDEEEEKKQKVELSKEFEDAVVNLMKDHLKQWGKDGMKITDSDRKQDDRKDYEEKKQKEIVRDIEDTTEPVKETKSLSEIMSKLAIRMKGIADSIDVDKALSDVARKIK